MKCPFCSANNDKVIDSRAAEGGMSIRRRRLCLNCGKRFTTYEHVETQIRLTVVKRDGTRVPYNREKMLSGLERACYKRPIAREVLEDLVGEVEEDLFKLGEREINSEEIGNMISEKLRKLDQVAYVRFASVYKQFRTVSEMMEEMQEVMAKTDPRQLPGQGQLFKG